MTFREKMDRYRAGTATPEERRAVEEELDKAAIINDYLFGSWEEGETAEAPAGELKQVKKSLRRRNIGLVLTSVVLVAVMLLSIPLVEKQYFDPMQQTTSSTKFSDLDIALRCYYNLFSPEQDYNFITSYTDTGFGRWSLELSFFDWESIGYHAYLTAAVDKNEIHFPHNTLFYSPTDLFNMGPVELSIDSVGYEADHEVGWQLAELEEDTSVYAAVSFNADLTAGELFAFMDRYSVIIRWAGVRAGHPSDPLKPLIGMELDGYWEDCGINADYPDLVGEVTADNAEQHFRSMVEYCRDYERSTINIGVVEDPEYYDKVLAELDENGLLFYGAYVTGSVQDFRDMAAQGQITHFKVLEVQDESRGFAYMAPSFGG